MTDLHKKFKKEVDDNIEKIKGDQEFQKLSIAWMRKSVELRYSYNFTSLGRPIIQYPTDIVATQELIWSVKPDLIIETGIAHGGSAIMSASCLALLDYCEAADRCEVLNPHKSNRKVLAVDIDIRKHQKEAITSHPMSHHIHMIEGSSVSDAVVEEVQQYSKDFTKIMVFLDSNHTHAHVLEELMCYGPLVTKGSYCVVWDGVVEHLSLDAHPNRPWGPGNNPYTALHEYLSKLATSDVLDSEGNEVKFEIDLMWESKLGITVAPNGFLKRI